jgi:hypothetical protein
VPGARSYTVENFMLDLDGAACGFVRSVGGGDTVAEVVEVPVAGSIAPAKHIAAPAVEDFVVEIGFGMSSAVYDWIAASWTGASARKDGSIVEADATLTARSERQFAAALLTETAFPALDAASKEAAYLTIRFAPESTRTRKATGKLSAPAGKQQQKLFQASNFRLELAGLDCSKVTRIDPFAVRQTVVSDQIGDARDYVKQPGRLEFPNLRVTIAETGAATWEAWFESFVVKGLDDDSREKHGAIVLLGPDLKAELARVELSNVGIFALRHPVRVAHDESIRRVVAELYCERMELKVPGTKS